MYKKQERTTTKIWHLLRKFCKPIVSHVSPDGGDHVPIAEQIKKLKQTSGEPHTNRG